jgi:hypothetical protein
MTSRSFSLFSAIVLTIGCAGCDGKSPIVVTGKLLKNGQPMVVSEDTYVTLSFVLETSGGNPNEARSHSAKFDQKTGTYRVELPPGNYRTMLAIALPGSKNGKLNMPGPPLKSEKVYELNKAQELDIEVPGK